MSIPKDVVVMALNASLGRVVDEPWGRLEIEDMERALTAAMPHLLAAKDAQIAALRALLEDCLLYIPGEYIKMRSRIEALLRPSVALEASIAHDGAKDTPVG